MHAGQGEGGGWAGGQRLAVAGRAKGKSKLVPCGESIEHSNFVILADEEIFLGTGRLPPSLAQRLEINTGKER